MWANIARSPRKEQLHLITMPRSPRSWKEGVGVDDDAVMSDVYGLQKMKPEGSVGEAADAVEQLQEHLPDKAEEGPWQSWRLPTTSVLVSSKEFYLPEEVWDAIRSGLGERAAEGSYSRLEAWEVTWHTSHSHTPPAPQLSIYT